MPVDTQIGRVTRVTVPWQLRHSTLAVDTCQWIHAYMPKEEEDTCQWIHAYMSGDVLIRTLSI